MHAVLNKEEGRKPHSPRYCHSSDRFHLQRGRKRFVRDEIFGFADKRSESGDLPKKYPDTVRIVGINLIFLGEEKEKGVRKRGGGNSDLLFRYTLFLLLPGKEYIFCFNT